MWIKDPTASPVAGPAGIADGDTGCSAAGDAGNGWFSSLARSVVGTGLCRSAALGRSAADPALPGLPADPGLGRCSGSVTGVRVPGSGAGASSCGEGTGSPCTNCHLSFSRFSLGSCLSNRVLLLGINSNCEGVCAGQ